VLADDELCDPCKYFWSKFTATPAYSEIAEFEELDGDLGEGFEVADGAVPVPTEAGSA
jgi:hypothetical protein